ncbi:alpha/beta hydrolase [Streptomyces johnsoniae]|uniref:Alpha/beta hydrolase family protein n=1 Tax=Streptomyces johnsoniae TaxID=3075532 RepID=A0ABU2S0F7_9ACTN|nr:alpha/beta hydrolase family protein [Streptomyces sp. DSM 41886]MDT0442263.1 alpha/beta hydrolase family protein [Streptomyces sp. DSM 41886]
MNPRHARFSRPWWALLCAVLLALPAVGGSSAAAARPDGATVVARERSGQRTLDLTIDSPALADEVKTRVLLPPGYADQPDRVWPVIYLLHGCCSRPGFDDWTSSADVAGLTAGTEALVVMPEGGSVGYYTNWWNAGRGGPPAWETFHLVELPRLLAGEVRAGSARAVAGASMGGTGALEYAGRHPGFFRAAASYSGRLNTRADAAAVMRRLEDFGHDPRAMWGDPEAQARIWSAHNPVEVLDRLPRGFPVYVSSGDGSPGPLDPPDAGDDGLERQFGDMAREYVARARGHGLAVTASLYGPGRHHYGYWEREFARSLPLLAEAVGAGSAGNTRGPADHAVPAWVPGSWHLPPGRAEGTRRWQER